MAYKDTATMSEVGGKRGRSQLRNIRRAGKKSVRDSGASDGQGTDSGDEMAEHSDNAGSDDNAESSDEDGEGRKEKVYSALLTILKSEHNKKKRKLDKQTSEDAEVNKDDIILQEEDKEDDDEDEEDEDAQIDNAIADVRDEEEDDDDDDVDTGNSDDEKDDSDAKDPFESHFSQVDEKFINELSSGFKERNIKYKTLKLNYSENEYALYSEPRLLDKDEKIVSPIIKSSIHSYFLKQRLKVQNNLRDDNKEDSLTPIQKQLVDPIFQYKDILYQYANYGKDEDEYRQLYALHILNHLYKTRDKILKDNQRIQDNPNAEHLDQGFTRPKILIVTPTRDTAYHIVNTIIEKSGIGQVDKKGKFKDQFFDSSLPPSSKPKSFQQIFKGNTNDFFVLGMKFTRKAIKLYSNFYQSDIIVCSPLGLQMIVENTDKKKRQDDFLSSIEITIIDQLHSMEFQNVSHIFTILEHLNNIPKEQHDTDFSRIRMWYINDQARFFRQTMIFTKYVSPVANSIINGKCSNWCGRWKNHRIINNEHSSINTLGLKIRQIFHKFDLVSGSIVDEPNYRFKFFTSVTIPNIVKTTGYEDGILIYIPDYTDYVRIRNYMKEKTTILFGDINEYSSQKQLNKNRTLFQQGRLKVLLYTERLHHYRRFEIKGVKEVIFYKPPSNPEFYNEVVRNIGKNAFLGNVDINISTVKTIFCKLDALNLENIVGSKRAGVLCHGQNEIYDFK